MPSVRLVRPFPALLALSLAALIGCGSGAGDGQQVQVSEEFQKKTDDMLKNYGAQYSQQYKAKKAAPKK